MDEELAGVERAPEDTANIEGEDTEVDSLRRELEASRENERAAVARLRSALLAGEPALDESMLGGDTLAEVEANYRAALAVLTKLREHVAKETAGRIPPGAPGRARNAPGTPFEKIRAGLERRGS